MNNIEFTLTKKIDYDLKPFGKFLFKWNPSKTINKRPHILGIGETSWSQEEDMPVDDDTDKKIVKFMKKHKTDVLINQYGECFSRLGNGFVPFTHSKIYAHKIFLDQSGMEDGQEAWENYINGMK